MILQSINYMKKILILLIILSGYSGRSQTYSVIHVLGKIYLPEEGIYLKQGQKINQDATLRFETPASRAAVLSSDRGRYVLQPQATSTVGNDLTFALASVVSPVRGRMSTRAGGINNKLDFEKRLSERPVAWLMDELRFQVSPSAFQINDERFFFIRYQYNDKEVNKRLKSRGDTLLIRKDELFLLDDMPIVASETSSHQLFYYHASEQSAMFITDFKFTLPGRDEILSIYEAMAGENQWQATYELVTEIFGACKESELRDFLFPEK